jgi:hypothetical protein
MSRVDDQRAVGLAAHADHLRGAVGGPLDRVGVHDVEHLGVGGDIEAGELQRLMRAVLDRLGDDVLHVASERCPAVEVDPGEDLLDTLQFIRRQVGLQHLAAQSDDLAHDLRRLPQEEGMQHMRQPRAQFPDRRALRGHGDTRGHVRLPPSA